MSRDLRNITLKQNKHFEFSNFQVLDPTYFDYCKKYAYQQTNDK